MTDLSPIQRKLRGFWNIETENSYWVRSNDYNVLGAIIYFRDKDTVKLPSLCCDKKIVEATKDATGTWKIISTNPDSVLFEVPGNPYQGKYAIRFFIDKDGYLDMKNNIYKIELKNDSTLLICNKGSAMIVDDVRDWEGKN